MGEQVAMLSFASLCMQMEISGHDANQIWESLKQNDIFLLACPTDVYDLILYKCEQMSIGHKKVWW